MLPPQLTERSVSSSIAPIKSSGIAFILLVIGGCVLGAGRPGRAQADQRPNVLIAISDDQSYPHASAYGYPALQTPAFDRVARNGVLFDNAFTPSPGCSPMRAAFLTGRYIWQLGPAGTHASSFPIEYEVFPERLEEAGYFVGYTGKGWGPGNWQVSGRIRNPAGPEFSARTLSSPPGIRNTDYAGNFAAFLETRPAGAPFCFWYGGSEPHRSFHPGIGRENGLDPRTVRVPDFLPDVPEVREDLLDYCYEIQWFDQHLGRMLDQLEKAGELANTLVIVTSDNGMAFPRAKANLYEYGIHMPLAVAWPDRIQDNRRIDELVNLIDLTATIYAAARVSPPAASLSGQSLLPLLEGARNPVRTESREAVFAGRERHSSARFRSLGYPQRCVRTRDYLYILNLRPERWPAGAPRKYGQGGYPDDEQVRAGVLGPIEEGYHDIDASPTLSYLIENRDRPEIGRYLAWAVEKRPREELYAIREDPACLNNLAEDPAFAAERKRLSLRLLEELTRTGDPRMGADGGQVWERYPRYSRLRWFPTPDWARRQPQRVPEQMWLEERRPQ